MLVALSVEDIFNPSVDIRIFDTSFTITVTISTPSSPLSICCPLALQVKLLATAVQVNSATPLTETLTARGGMVISAIKENTSFY